MAFYPDYEENVKVSIKEGKVIIIFFAWAWT